MKKSLGKVRTFVVHEVKNDNSDLKIKQTSSFQKVYVFKRPGKKYLTEKSSYSRLNFCNQLIKYSMFLLSQLEIQKKELSEHHCV